MNGRLRAGARSVPITPPVGVDLSGYGYREGASEGIHDDLWCRALVLDDGASRIALLALDLLAVDYQVDAALRSAISAAAELPRDRILINCSHTHAGPATTRLEGLGKAHAEYVSSLPARAAEAVAEAASRLRPAELRYGETAGGVGINRRERRADGQVILGRNPQGLADGLVRVLRVNTAQQLSECLAFNHACHGTTLGQGNRLVSAEWMGAASTALERSHGGPAVAVFLQGCCGAINPDSAGATFDEVRRLGERMAGRVKAAAGAADPINGLPLSGARRHVPLPLQDAQEPERARAELAQAEEELARVKASGSTPHVVRSVSRLVSHARAMVVRAERGGSGETLPFALQVMRIGELALVGLAGEVFLEFAHRIISASPFRHTLVLAYSNGCTCYVPTAEAFVEGGYEAEQSFRWYGVPPLAPQAGDVMVAGAVELLQEVGKE